MCNTGIIAKVLTYKHRINVSTSYCEHCGCALYMRVCVCMSVCLGYCLIK